MNNLVLYGSIFVLALYYASRLLGAFLRKYDWHLWYTHFYLRSPHWKFLVWRKDLQMRILHGHLVCEKCGNEQSLQHHHIDYKRLGHERLSDLQILCKYCHRQGSGKI